MAKMTFLFACARLKDYFSPLGFESDLDSPVSMSARVFDIQTGEDLAFVSGLAWSGTATNEDLVRIISSLEQEMEARQFLPTSVDSDVKARG